MWSVGDELKSKRYTEFSRRSELLRLNVFLVSLCARAIRAMCCRRADLMLENLVLQQQVAVLKKERPRPPIEDTDRAFWVALRSS